MQKARATHFSDPGEFRKSQNWIGGTRPDNAHFVPPPVDEMNKALNDLELFFNKEDSTPTVIKAGIIHAQFETIHPFNDGNGRIGRMIIILYLMQHKIINCKGIYLSAYFQKHRDRYYTYLTEIRETAHFTNQPAKHYAAIIKWIEFFLNGLKETANDGLNAIASSIALKINFSRFERPPNSGRLIRSSGLGSEVMLL
jgi:Fic family protein